MSVRVAWGIAIILACASLGPRIASAQANTNAARDHYMKAEAALARGDFDEATHEYGAAYDLTKDPILFFKIGKTNELAGKCPIAITYFARYLKEGNPAAEHRKQTEERITACQALIDKTKTGGSTGDPDPGKPDPGTTDPDPGKTDPGPGKTDPDPGKTDPDGQPDHGAASGGTEGPAFTDQPRPWKRSAAWIATGTAVGLFAIGTVLHLSAEGSEEDLQALIDSRQPNGRPVPFDDIRDQYNDLVDEGDRYDQLATVAYVATGLSAAAAATFFVLQARDDEKARAADKLTRAYVAPKLHPHGAGVVMGWSF